MNTLDRAENTRMISSTIYNGLKPGRVGVPASKPLASGVGVVRFLGKIVMGQGQRDSISDRDAVVVLRLVDRAEGHAATRN